MSRLGLFLFSVTLLLSSIGVFVLYESSSYNALLHIGDKYYFIKNQIVWVILGIIISLVVSRIHYKKLYYLSLPLLVISIFSLLLVFIPGLGLSLKGAHRWIDLRFTVVQPSEFLKITLNLYLAAWLSNKEKGRLLAFLLLFGACLGLIMLQPDMGTAMIIAGTSVFVYFLSGARIKEMGIILGIFIVMGALLIAVAPYRAARFASFSNFDARDINTASYHTKQILISLGSGGFWGMGFGNSIQKYAYLPENTTDSIFAIYAEEGGFVGSLFLIGLFLVQISLGFIIATRIKDTFGKLLALGISTFLGIQAFLNIASQAVLIPLTGVPLPFISYGGSSMLINFAAIGILIGISRHIDRK